MCLMVHLHTYIHVNCNMMPRYWVICTMLGCMTDDVSTVAEPETQCYDIGLLRPKCWVRRVYIHHVVRLHDRWCQHCCRAKDLILGCWGRRVGSDVSIGTVLLDCMTDDVSTVAEPETQYHAIRFLRPIFWVRCVSMHHIVRLHNRWRQHCYGAKDAMPWYWVVRPTCWVGCVYMHHYGIMNCWKTYWQCVNY